MRSIQPAALIVAGAVVVAGVTTVLLGYRAAVSADGTLPDVGQRERIAAGSAPVTLAGNSSDEGLTRSTEAQTSSKDGSTRENKEKSMKTATFAAGCFWGVEAAFRRVDGVTETEVGYTGGHVPDPDYDSVCHSDTGHAEAVRVVYDPKKVDYDDLLRVFWSNHDPTQLNRQGPDVGEQYRSAIFYHNEEQKQTAERSKQRVNASSRYRGRVVTQIVPATEFYRAEEYHQQYLEKRGEASCPSGL